MTDLHKQAFTQSQDADADLNANALSALSALAGGAVLLNDHNSAIGGSLVGGAVGTMAGYHGAKLFNVDRDSRFAAALLLSIAGSVGGAYIAKNASIATVSDKPWKYLDRKTYMRDYYFANLKEKSKGYITPGLLGAGILALATAMYEGKTAKPGHVALAGLLGGTAAVGGAFIKDLFYGPSYRRTYTNKHIKPGEDVVVAFSGSGTGDGNVDRKMYEAFGPGKYALFRWHEKQPMLDFVNSLPADSKAHLIGYSWGGKTLRQALPGIKHKNVEYHFIDPVGWRADLADDQVPGYRYNPTNKETFFVDEDKTWNNLTRTFGGGHTYKDAIRYKGDHCDIGPVLLAIAQHIKTGGPIEIDMNAPHDPVRDSGIFVPHK